MKKLFLLAFVLSGCAVLSPLQKGRFISISNLIEASKFEEAKKMIDQMTDDRESAKWPKTWYMKGLLCQTAYFEGVKKNSDELQNLYPNQLNLALVSYQRAKKLDTKGKLDKSLAPNYVLLANEFQRIGKEEFTNKKYSNALVAFEKALAITQGTTLSIETDTNLVYNTALAAFESKNWDKAVEHLQNLHKKKHSINSTHLLFLANLEKGDTLTAKKVIKDGIERFNTNEQLVLLLTDLLYKQENMEEAFLFLDKIIAKKPTNANFHYTKALLYQKNERYTEAISNYAKALKYDASNLMAYVNTATCYYNIGVDINEQTQSIANNRKVVEEKVKAQKAFDSAIEWLNKVKIDETTSDDIVAKVYELNKALKSTGRSRDI
ncbi:MAG: tetratricopeptide repeat protein [Bacteroidales bacterium]|nr:tetratricopeptide repeat protein [Tenuifilaceae bacterium]